MNPLIYYDELPLWSAPFGLILLDTIRMKPGMNILDIGSGSGFPMFEIAGRMGSSCSVYGLDPSEDSMKMIRAKMKVNPIPNISIIKGFAEEMPFPDGFFHLIVSNNGINNVTDQQKVFSECNRVSDPDAQMVFTVNLPDTMVEFYEIFETTLSEMRLTVEIEKMHRHIYDKRKPVDELKELIQSGGFSLHSLVMDDFKIRTMDGTAFFDHPLIRKAFMGPWKSILPEHMIQKVFTRLKERLNTKAEEHSGLSFSVPFACFDCRKIKPIVPCR
jgi:ubiquinone/menaquinone biosynthesis C-methylase UbiE